MEINLLIEAIGVLLTAIIVIKPIRLLRSWREEELEGGMVEIEW